MNGETAIDEYQMLNIKTRFSAYRCRQDLYVILERYCVKRLVALSAINSCSYFTWRITAHKQGGCIVKNIECRISGLMRANKLPWRGVWRGTRVIFASSSVTSKAADGEASMASQ